jgi:hypothetical protein
MEVAMPDNNLPQEVKKVLLPGETILSRFTSSEKDVYATSNRVLLFQRPTWAMLLGIFYLLTAKSFSGILEYSNISGISVKRATSPSNKMILLVGAGICVIMGLIFIISIRNSKIPEAWWIGLLPFVIALYFALLTYRKFDFWQFDLINPAGKSPAKWWLPARNQKAGEFSKRMSQILAKSAAK